jgi:hypothetical protein
MQGRNRGVRKPTSWRAWLACSMTCRNVVLLFALRPAKLVPERTAFQRHLRAISTVRLVAILLTPAELARLEPAAGAVIGASAAPSKKQLRSKKNE